MSSSINAQHYVWWFADDDGDSIMDEEFYMKESTERREKLEDHELLFEALSKSDSRVINLHVDPSTGAVDVEGSDEDSDEGISRYATP